MTSQDESLFDGSGSRQAEGPVECLGLTFASDEERRSHFVDLLRERLKDPEFRAIDGFPSGSDEDVLTLSDPPYYTACPNPWFEELMALYGRPYEPETDEYRREPFAADVSEGKNDPIYNAHSYHTKVPHKAIMRYILHYTEPGDVVFDGFCGTGMTGVAAHLCGHRKTIESLGYTVRRDGSIVDERGDTISRIGERYAVLNDISPAATFVASSLARGTSSDAFLREAKNLIAETRADLDWLYRTTDPATGDFGEVVYSVWSDVLVCSECGQGILAWDVVVDASGKTMRSEFDCPSCGAALKRRQLAKAMETVMDPVLGHPIARTVQREVIIHFLSRGQRRVKEPDSDDAGTVARAEALAADQRLPVVSFEHTLHHLHDGNHLRGITHLHHFFHPRNLVAISELLGRSRRSHLGWDMLFALTGCIHNHLNRRNRYILDRHHPQGTPCGPLSSTMFVPELQCEVNAILAFEKSVRKQQKALAQLPGRAPTFIGVGSATSQLLPEASVDYAFLDPPFGDNIHYSDLNLLWEGWLGVLTNSAPEAVMNRAESKGLREYGQLMTSAFRSTAQSLKPGRWLTLAFHNSRNAVWAAIQDALEAAGFVIGDVRVMDKVHGTLHQDSGYTVKQDLVISAYKPVGDVERQFSLQAGTPQAAWTFARGHLGQLPVVVEQNGTIEVIAERQAHLLFDRMVAFHVRRGVQVPLSAVAFNAGLEQRFSCRDGMYFLPEQAAEYDRKRIQAQEVRQLEFFVSDEESAIQWLRRLLSDKPTTFQDIHPLFMREIAGWGKHERPLELSELLEENFIRYDSVGEVPSQIHAYLSSNFREMRGLDKSDSVLQAKAKDRWYVPDTRKAGDLEQLRERTLLKEFDDYVAEDGRLKVLRIEAVRAGFKRAWQEHDYGTIIAVSERLPADVLQEDAKLLMWYDQALTRAGE